jgi:hypothetical protein
MGNRMVEGHRRKQIKCPYGMQSDLSSVRLAAFFNNPLSRPKELSHKKYLTTSMT